MGREGVHMLMGIPDIISPELLKILMEMGHGDQILLADGNFPGASMARRLIRADGHGVPELLDAILKLMPLDGYVKAPVQLMQVVPGDNVETPIWQTYEEIITRHAPASAGIEHVERFAFYERAQKAYAIVQTGDRALYANIMLQKGVVV